MPVYKDEKRKTWFVSFYYTDWQGKKVRKKKEGFKTQKEAKAFEINFLNKQQADCNMLFSNLVEIYLEDCQTRLKPTTLQTKKNTINKNILPFFHNMPINKINATVFRKWQNEMLKLNFSQTFLRLLHGQASTIFNFAVKYYNLQQNPAKLCGGLGKSNADAMMFWTVEDFSKFISFIPAESIFYLAFNLLFFSGIRLGEMLALTLNDFNFNNKTLSINKNYARLHGEDLILKPKTPKSKRIITLPLELFSMLTNHISSLYDYKPTERLFSISSFMIRHNITKYCEQAGVQKIRLHDLRHSHASLLIELGFSPLLISERLGHDNVQTTLQTYSHLYPNKHAEVSDKLSTLIK